jgi:hypothetical protein
VVVRAARLGGQPDLARHRLWLADRLDDLVQSRRRNWVLALIEQEPQLVKGDLLERADAALSATTNPLIREFGSETGQDQDVGLLLDDLISEHLVAIDPTERLTLTDQGRHHLRQSANGHR